ncbi:MAG: hypothetical protein K0R84_2981 [Clostridia bacterium]|jgi:hypothetical protein|nr:hypothetical protein [Clostridia bacterium]
MMHWWKNWNRRNMNNYAKDIPVITSAIAAFLGDNTNIVIKSIKRVPRKSSNWTMAARRRHMRTWQRR